MRELLKITESELKDKRLYGLDDTPGLSGPAMQARFDAHPDKNTEVINQHALVQNENNQSIDLRLNNAEEELNKRVLKEEGKGLSHEDFTFSEKEKLSLIEERANNYILPNATENSLGGIKGGYGTDILPDGTLNILPIPSEDPNAREEISLHENNFLNPHRVSLEQLGGISKDGTIANSLKLGGKTEGELSVKESMTSLNSLSWGGKKIWCGIESEKGTDENTIYFCY